MTLSLENGMHIPNFAYTLRLYGLTEVLRYDRALYLQWRDRQKQIL